MSATSGIAGRRAARDTELLEGKMGDTQRSQTVKTKLQQIAEASRRHPERAFTTLAHHIDLEWLIEAYHKTRKSGAAGVDGQTADEYAENLEESLRSLLDRFKSGTYRAPLVSRVHIPKGSDGKQTRPIGIPTIEDKVMQRAVTMLLEAIYEQDFLDCSYGFRPGRGAHQALQGVWKAAMSEDGGWVIEVDIRRFFDEMPHERLTEVVRRRVRDGVLLRIIGKWLNAGVMEDGSITHPETGTPQGGVISGSPMDVWFARVVRKHLRGYAAQVRYADDIVMVFEQEDDARRVFEVLPKRVGKYGLKLHPDKTQVVKLEGPGSGDLPGPRSFDFLGFTHHWSKSRRGNWVVKQKTANDRFSRTLHRIRERCRTHRHERLVVQQQGLAQQLRAHYGYFGITQNYLAHSRVLYETQRAWYKWLSRRSGTKHVDWERMKGILERFALPSPQITHQYVT
jgi:group II intron reverse transcriptase/maturase